MQSSLRPAVFLDRDGTIIDEIEFLTDPDRLRLLPGAAAAIRRLNEVGLAVVVVTNQSMIARGLASERQLAAVNARLRDVLAGEGARLDATYYCPHHPDIGEPPYRAVCNCRKPLPGLLHQAARDLGLALPDSSMIGDTLRDLEAGDAAGCRALILVRTGHGLAQEAATRAAKLGRPVTVCADLAAAIDHLLSQDSMGSRPAPPLPATPQSHQA